ncbi:MAG: hypothetical protein JST54_02705 [Deltaproteobacteria bacterium]|nr:hypothetical protein [Deltaproteobacteria bacterium]
MSRGLFLLLLLVAPSAFAEPTTWSAGLSSLAVKKALPNLPAKVMVVREGPSNEELDAAATALVQALRAAGATALDDAALGDTSQLFDAEIVQKAAALGVDAVALLRVAPMGDAPPQAQVDFLDAHGKQLGALVAEAKPDAAGSSESGSEEAATPVTPQPQVAVPPPGQIPPPPVTTPPVSPYVVPGRPVQAPLTPEVPPGPAQARAAYAEQFVGFGAYARWTYWGPQWFEGPYLGTMHQPLAMPEFFDRVGRHDLADSYRSRETTRNTLIVGGSLVVVGSLIAAIAIANSAPTFDTCGFPATTACLHSVDDSRASASTGAALVGIGGSGLGLVLAGFGWQMNPMPITGVEAHQLAGQFNLRLQQKLGLGARAEREDPDPIRITLSPSVGPGRGAMALRLEF